VGSSVTSLASRTISAVSLQELVRSPGRREMSRRFATGRQMTDDRRQRPFQRRRDGETTAPLEPSTLISQTTKGLTSSRNSIPISYPNLLSQSPIPICVICGYVLSGSNPPIPPGWEQTRTHLPGNLNDQRSMTNDRPHLKRESEKNLSGGLYTSD